MYLKCVYKTCLKIDLLMNLKIELKMKIPSHNYIIYLLFFIYTMLS